MQIQNLNKLASRTATLSLAAWGTIGVSRSWKDGGRDQSKLFSTSNESKDTERITETGTRELLTCATALLRREVSNTRSLADWKISFGTLGLLNEGTWDSQAGTKRLPEYLQACLCNKTMGLTLAVDEIAAMEEPQPYSKRGMLITI